jgi:hypothetical protein
MRKQPCVLVVLFILLAPFAVAQTKTGREKAGLRGKVESVRVEKSEIREQEGTPVESNRQLESVVTYDKKGEELEQFFYYNGIFLGKRTTLKDYTGNVTLTHYNHEGIMTGRMIIKYDESGRTTGSLAYDADGNLSRQVNYIYNQWGNLIEASFDFVNNRAFSTRNVYVYDDAGRHTADRFYDGDGVLKREIIYPDRGRSVDSPNQNGSTTKLADAVPFDPSDEYDSQGNWTKRSQRREIIESGQTREVVEVTYRKITYH